MHTKHDQTESPRRRILVILLDADGCIFNQQYITKSMQPVPDESDHAALLTANAAFFEFIQETIRKGGYDEVVLRCGSNRQCFDTDAFNAYMNKNSSFFIALQDIIHKQIQTNFRNTILDKRLLPDYLYPDRERSTFDDAIQSYSNSDISNRRCPIDESKIIIVYSTAHSIINHADAAKIDLMMIDDSARVHADLSNFLEVNADMIPSTVEVHLVPYNGAPIIPENIKSYKGSGSVDHDLHTTLKQFLQIAGISLNQPQAVDPVSTNRPGITSFTLSARDLKSSIQSVRSQSEQIGNGMTSGSNHLLRQDNGTFTPLSANSSNLNLLSVSLSPGLTHNQTFSHAASASALPNNQSFNLAASASASSNTQSYPPLFLTSLSSSNLPNGPNGSNAHERSIREALNHSKP